MEVALDLHVLDKLVHQRLLVCISLEKAVAIYKATHRRPRVTISKNQGLLFSRPEEARSGHSDSRCVGVYALWHNMSMCGRDRVCVLEKVSVFTYACMCVSVLV